MPVKVVRPTRAGARGSVTVMVPCYRYGRFLPDVVGSALAQEGVDVDVLIVDDASPDDSAEVAGRLAAADPRVHVLRHEVNKGHIATYNDGLALATGEFVTLVSADDVLAPGALQRAVQLMRAFPSVGMVYGLPISFTDELPEPAPACETWTVWGGRTWLRTAAVRGRSFVLSPEVVMRTAALREVGLYNPDLPHSADLELWLRTALRWDVGRVNGPPQAFYRTHGDNMHLTEYAGAVVDLVHRERAFRFLAAPEAPRTHVTAAWCHRRARVALAREALVLASRALAAGAAPQEVEELLHLAQEWSSTSRGRARLHAVLAQQARLVRAGRPDPRDRAVELLRGQVDRARWTLWRWVGVS